VIAALLFEHAAPRWLIYAAVAGAVGLALFWYWRYLRRETATWVLALLRVAFFLTLGWCLLRPLLKESYATALRPRFLVLVDTSASMQLAPKENLPTRWTTASQLAAQPWQKTLAKRAEIETYAFATDLGERVVDLGQLQPTGATTHLREALRKLVERYRGQPLGGVLLLTDGIDTRETTTDWAGVPWPCPIYTVPLEPLQAWDEEPDVRVTKVDTPRRVIAGWESKLTAVIGGSGTRGQMLSVQVFENDRLIEEQPTQLPTEGGTREVSFMLQHPTVGNFTYTVVCPPLPGEVITNDNRYAISVQVVDTKNRLLYVEGPPRFESKFLTRALQANQTITPLIFLQGANKKFFTVGQRGSMTADMSAEQLAQFKIVILGDLTAEVLGETRARALLKFVEDGGSLVLLGGPNAWGRDGFAESPLARLLPVARIQALAPREGRFMVHWTDEGKSHPAFAADAAAWENAPPILSLFPGSELAPGAVALAETEDSEPVIAAQRFGQGKVVAVLTDSLWRWQLHPGQANTFGKFWNQLLEWLTPAATETQPFELDLFADSEQVYLGDPLPLQARLSGAESAAVICEIQTPDERKITFPMTPRTVTTSTGKTYQGFGLEFTGQNPGLHTAVAVTTVDGKRVESAPYSFFLKPFTPETAPRPANFDLLKALATASGGKYLQPDELNAVLAALDLTGTEEERVTYASLWNTWPVWACLTALLAVEWVIRKMRNLP